MAGGEMSGADSRCVQLKFAALIVAAMVAAVALFPHLWLYFSRKHRNADYRFI